jgi:uncharacterized Rossmann fold enzyme
VEGPPALSFDDQLVWALGHPDGDRAVLAAQTLGAGREELREWLEHLTHSESFMVRDVAHQALP